MTIAWQLFLARYLTSGTQSEHFECNKIEWFQCTKLEKPSLREKVSIAYEFQQLNGLNACRLVDEMDPQADG
jgi:hypothetical protein